MSDIRIMTPSGWRDVKGTSDGRIVFSSVVQEIEDVKILSASTDYAAEDVLSDVGGTAWSFPNVPTKGKIHDAKLLLSPTALAWRTSLYLFRAEPTSTKTDNAANVGPSAADRAIYINRIDFPDTEDLGGMSETEATPSTTGNLPMNYDLQGATDIWGLLVLRDAETGEVANMVASIRLHVEPME